MFDVYVVGATTAGEEGLDQLAEAMSRRYGAPLEDLRSRLGRGRFRVKANVDRATADAYIKDLLSIGGRCSLEEASTAPNQSIPPPISVPTPSRTTTPPAGLYQSGLSAAFSGSDLPTADLGALGRADAFSLASLDGHDGHAGARCVDRVVLAAARRRRGPARWCRRRAGQGAAPARRAGRARSVQAADSEDDNLQVEIAADELEHSARKRRATPPPANVPITAPAPGQAQAPAPVARRSSVSVSPLRVAEQPVAIVRPPGRLGPLGDDRVRFVLGVAIAIVLGFVPAHVVASMRERKAYHAIDSSVEQRQIDATAQEDYDALDAFRARQLEDKRSAHHSIALMAFAIWAAAGGAIAFGWFKSIPWDRLDEPRSS